MHPYTMYTMATQRQADLIAEADHERLVREARKQHPREPQSPGRRLVAAAAAAALALSIAGAAFAAQNAGSTSNDSSNAANRGGEACVAIGDGGKLAC